MTQSLKNEKKAEDDGNNHNMPVGQLAELCEAVSPPKAADNCYENRGHGEDNCYGEKLPRVFSLANLSILSFQDPSFGHSISSIGDISAVDFEDVSTEKLYSSDNTIAFNTNFDDDGSFIVKIPSRNVRATSANEDCKAPSKDLHKSKHGNNDTLTRHSNALKLLKTPDDYLEAPAVKCNDWTENFDYDMSQAFPVPLSENTEKRLQEVRDEKKAATLVKFSFPADKASDHRFNHCETDIESENDIKSEKIATISVSDYTSSARSPFTSTDSNASMPGRFWEEQQASSDRTFDGDDLKGSDDTLKLKRDNKSRPRKTKPDLLEGITMGFFSGQEVDLDAIALNNPAPTKSTKRRRRNPGQDFLKDISMGFFSRSQAEDQVESCSGDSEDDTHLSKRKST